MERVQFEQEQMLPELKDLVQKGLFSDKEIKQIMRKRATFETNLVRRVTKKSDFLRYIGYEMNLEALRRKRVARLNLPYSPPTISDYAIVRRQFKIFERALRKFKDDVGLWIQYIRLAKREKARALVGRITARALKLHPTNPSLYILAASHELTHLSPSAARTLLQRGLRLNPESVELWREYVKVELGFVEGLRRRWEVLGVDKRTEHAGGAERDVEMGDVQGPGDSSEDGALEQEKARKEILSGALVKTVIDNAIQSLPTLPLLTALHSTLLSYPASTTLRSSLLDHFFLTLESSPSLHGSPEAVKLHATRELHENLEGADLVDGLKKANEEMVGKVKAADQKQAEGLARVYAAFVEEWTQKDIDENLKLYLITSLHSLIASSSRPPHSLVTSHLRLLASPQTPQPLQASKLLKLARKYTSKAPHSSELWLLRLDIEEKHTEKDEWMKVWEDARKYLASAGGERTDEERESVWVWGFDHIASLPLQEQIGITESLIVQALPFGTPALPTKLLRKYTHLLHAQFIHERTDGTYKDGSLTKRLERMAERFLPTEDIWEQAFKLFSSSHSHSTDDDSGSESESEISSRSPPTFSTPPSPDLSHTLHTIFNHWRLVSPSAHCRAALAYGAYLLREGRGTEATGVVAGARAEAPQEEKAGFERAWRAVVDGGDVDGGKREEEEEEECDDDADEERLETE